MTRNEFAERLNGLEAVVQGLIGRVEVLEARARAQQEHKNTSSALLREMTKEDARRVLAGDLAEMAHKDAAVELGLSYQQIYSCRFGYTFKPIHRDLEKSGWRNTKWLRK